MASWLCLAAIGVLPLAGAHPSPPGRDLSLTISSNDARACRGVPQIQLKAEVANSGKDAFAIRFDSVGQIIEFHPQPKIKPGESRANVGSYRMVPLMEKEFQLLEPGKSLTRDIVFKIPADLPAGTDQLRIVVLLIAQPKEKKHQDTKTFRGDIQSNQLQVDLMNCAGSKP